MKEFKALGKSASAPTRELEVFAAPGSVHRVVLETSEVTSLCPVTGQPDWQQVIIEYAPGSYCIESKSLKLYLWSFREVGVFCEALADQIAADVYAACEPRWCKVTIKQAPRGGISITAVAVKGDSQD